MGIGYMIGWLIGVLVASIVFGCITRHINESKGYYGGFAWGFWLGWIGIIVVACKPNCPREATEYRPMYGGALSTAQKPELPSWTCRCGSKNPGRLDYCPICRRSREDSEKREVKCPGCGAYNLEDREYCVACNRPLKPQPAIAATAATAAPVATPVATPVTTPVAPVAQPAPTVHAASAGEIMAELQLLEKLAQLYNAGILTEAEYNEKKQAILAKI